MVCCSSSVFLVSGFWWWWWGGLWIGRHLFLVVVDFVVDGFVWVCGVRVVVVAVVWEDQTLGIGDEARLLERELVLPLECSPIPCTMIAVSRTDKDTPPASSIRTSGAQPQNQKIIKNHVIFKLGL